MAQSGHTGGDAEREGKDADELRMKRNITMDQIIKKRDSVKKGRKGAKEI